MDGRKLMYRIVSTSRSVLGAGVEVGMIEAMDDPEAALLSQCGLSDRHRGLFRFVECGDAWSRSAA